MNAVTEIEVAFVNQPKEGKKMGSIKSKDGQFYNAFPEMLSQFRQGMKCQVEYEARPRDGGGEWRTIKKVIGASTAPMMPKHNYSAGKNPAESKQIGVLAITKDILGKLPPQDPELEEKMVYVLECGMRAYSRTLGGVQAQRRDDMDDEIPY